MMIKENNLDDGDDNDENYNECTSYENGRGGGRRQNSAQE